MATLSPLARVKADFGGKDKLVDKIVGLLGSGDEPKEDMRRRLLGAANKKLIRLHTVATELKAAGGKDAAAAAAATEMGRGKDKDYVAKLGTYSSARVIDMLTVAKRRKSRAAAKPAARPAAKTAAKAAAPKAKPAAAASKKKPGKS